MEKFKIFVPNKNFRLTINHILYTPFLVFLSILLINDNSWKNQNIQDIFTFLTCLILIPIMYYFFACHFMTQKTYGILSDFIEFHIEKVEYEQNEIKLSEIEKIEFFIGASLGQYCYGSHRTDLRTRKSNGNNSAVWIHKKDKTIIFKIFHLSKKEDFYKKMREYLIVYHIEGKMSFLRLLEHLSIHDYNEIQKFKQEINSKKV